MEEEGRWAGPMAHQIASQEPRRNANSLQVTFTMVLSMKEDHKFLVYLVQADNNDTPADLHNTKARSR